MYTRTTRYTRTWYEWMNSILFKDTATGCIIHVVDSNTQHWYTHEAPDMYSTYIDMHNAFVYKMRKTSAGAHTIICPASESGAFV